MNRQEYLRALDAALSNLVSPQERENILRYYGEYFDEAGAEGEQALIQELGNPFELAKRLAEDGGFAPKDVASGQRMGQGVKTALIAVGTVAACLLLLAVLKVVPFSVHKSGVVIKEDAVVTEVTAMLGTAGEFSSDVTISSVTDSSGYSGEAFSAIKLDIAIGDVELCAQGDEYRVELEWNRDKKYEMTAQVRRGVLQVTGAKSASGLNLGDYAAKATIVVPEGAGLTSVELNNGMGNITVRNITAVELEAETGMGNVSVDNCTVSTELQAKTDMGDIDFRGFLARKTSLETDLGNVEADVLNARAKCGYELECDLGEVKVDRRDQGRSAYQVGKGGDPELEAVSDLGNVSVRFGAES